MKIIIEANAKEVAALVVALQERRERDAVMLVRKPYQRTYSVCPPKSNKGGE